MVFNATFNYISAILYIVAVSLIIKSLCQVSVRLNGLCFFLFCLLLMVYGFCLFSFCISFQIFFVCFCLFFYIIIVETFVVGDERRLLISEGDPGV